MEENQNKDWLRTEYQLLSEHYFHEDNYYLGTNTLFLTLNAALLGVFSGELPGNISILDQYRWLF
jgi:hypothetical protein